MIGFLCIRFFLASVLIIAGSSKLADRAGFVMTLIALGVPQRRKTIAHNLALIISFAEILIGLFVIFGIWQTISDLLLLVTMLGFLFVVIVGLYKAPHAHCRCFGPLDNSKFNAVSLLRNALLVIAALSIFLLRNSLSLQRPPTIMYVLLLAGYLLLALGAAQSAKIVVLVKDKVS